MAATLALLVTLIALLLLYRLVAFAWAAALLACVGYAAVGLARATLAREGEREFGPVVWPAVIGAFLSGPLWAEAVLLEVACRQAGLHIAAPQPATTEGLFWRSHAVAPNAYSNGVPSYGDPLRQTFLLQSIRAVAEGRIGYLEVPLEPPGSSDSPLTQKIFVAPKAVARSRCLHLPMGSGFGKLPDEYCVAWETVQGLHTRYELVGMLAEGTAGTRFSIKDRVTSQELVRHTFVRAIRVEPKGLTPFGLQPIQPRSCRRAMTDTRPAANLVALAFARQGGGTLNVNMLESYEAEPWSLSPSVHLDPLLPDGRAGVEYLIRLGKVRRLTSDDFAMWRSADPQRLATATYVPSDTFYIDREITLPAGMDGGNGVTWILKAGQPIPSGPRGSNRFLEIGKGCVWSPSGCQ